MRSFFMTVCMLCSLAAHVHAEGCDVVIKYEGKGAGQVVFDGPLHMSKGYTCATCHERQGLSLALFEMKKGADILSMRKFQLGRSCGYCHDGSQAFSVTDKFTCSRCHRK